MTGRITPSAGQSIYYISISHLSLYPRCRICFRLLVNGKPVKISTFRNKYVLCFSNHLKENSWFSLLLLLLLGTTTPFKTTSSGYRWGGHWQVTRDEIYRLPMFMNSQYPDLMRPRKRCGCSYWQICGDTRHPGMPICTRPCVNIRNRVDVISMTGRGKWWSFNCNVSFVSRSSNRCWLQTRVTACFPWPKVWKQYIWKCLRHEVLPYFSTPLLIALNIIWYI